MPREDDFADPTAPRVRPNFYSGRLLTADDLTGEQRYQLGRHELHAAALHGLGIVSGLEVSSDGNLQVTVSPGLAVDGLGHVVGVPVAYTCAVGATSPSVLVLRSAEEPVEPTPDGQPAGTADGFEVVAIDPGTEGPGDVVLASMMPAPDGTLSVDVEGRTGSLPSIAGLAAEIERLTARVAELEARLSQAGDTPDPA